MTGGARTIIPSVKELGTRSGFFIVPSHLTVSGPAQAARPLLRVLEDCGALETVGHVDRGYLDLQLVGAAPPAGPDPLRVGDESYELEIGPSGIMIRGTMAGIRHGVATIMALLPPECLRPGSGAQARLPFVTISDRPRYPWRGLLVDVARHFMPITWLRTLVDIAAFHKLNVIHLHLTDDQGWRMPIDAFPRLATHASRRKETLVGPAPGSTFDGKPHGGIYTKAELRDFASYASSRGVRVVPEIDLPGHMAAAISAYPEWGNVGEVDVWTTWGVSPTIINPRQETVDALKAILDEVMDTFDSPVIHIGGDEVPTTQWENNPDVEAIMAEHGLEEVRHLQGWIMSQLIDHVEAAGRRVIAWDDAVAARVPTSVMIQAWTSPDAVAMAIDAGYETIVSPQQHYYLGFSAALGRNEPIGYGVGKDIHTPLDAVGEYLVPEEAIGVEATIWAEYIKTPAKASYQLLPRLAPVAERAWSGNDVVGSELETSIAEQVTRYEHLGWDHRPLDGPGLRWSRVWGEETP